VKRVVLGIGNPGPEYDGTRHNAGFMVLDRVAERLGLRFERLQRESQDGVKRFGGKVKARVAEGVLPVAGVDEPFLLVEPLTYVNLSGDVAGPLLRAFALPPESLFVIVDDLNLPLGRIRIRPSGSSGGHNGLKSIEQALGTQEYPRLRLGIGGPGDGASQREAVVDHVLTRFLPKEREVLGPVLELSADAVVAWLSGSSIASLMERCHRAGGGPESV
jgi:PTH1 family peptidyl-tRNA hydrolase